MARWPWTLKLGLASLILAPVSVMAEMELVLVEENVRLTIPEAGIRSIEVETWAAKTLPESQDIFGRDLFDQVSQEQGLRCVAPLRRPAYGAQDGM